MQGSVPYGNAVQFKRRIHTDGGENKTQIAADGVAGCDAPIPYIARIQASFGHHDLSGARARVGGEARIASERMGAEAYTTGDRVGFRESPDLRLAAHEAAHVVQQRSGVQLFGEAGADGDRYERNADAVADRVVAGESAEDLLDTTAGSGEGSGAENKVQLRRYNLNGRAWDVDLGRLAEGGEEGVIATPVEHSAILTVEALETAMELLPGSLIATSTPNQFRISEDSRSLVRQQICESTESGGDEFETSFNTEFHDILHIFPTAPQGQSGQRHVGMDQIRDLLTDEQIRKLRDFFATHEIPDRLFNGVENRPALTAQMRILMASHILMTGRQRPGVIPGETTEDRGAVARERRGTSSTTPTQESTSEQSAGETTSSADGSSTTPTGSLQVAARCCRHWVMLVHAYAGITAPETGEGGVQHTFDHQGHAVIGQGSVTVNRGGGTAFNNIRGAEPRDMPYSNPDLFEPGDWLELAWDGHVGAPTEQLPHNPLTHSVILVEVVTRGNPTYSIKHISQTQNPNSSRDGHGRPRPPGGERDIRTMDISRRTCQGMPVVYGYHRVSADSGSATTEAAVLGSGGGDVSGQNRAYLGSDRMRRRLNLGRTAPAIDVDDLSRWLCEWLQRRNTELIAGLDRRLSDMQRNQLTQANRYAVGDTGALERLVRLTQRLLILEHNRAHVAQSDQAQMASMRREGTGRDFWIAHNDTIGRDSLHGTRSESRRVTGLVADLPAGFVPWSEYSSAAQGGGQQQASEGAQ